MSSQPNRGLFFIGLIFFLVSCQSRSYRHVQVSRGYPRGQCRELGQVIGNANSRENPRQQAYEHLRFRAAQIDANYVRMIAETSSGSAVRGIAYRCQ